MKKIIYIGVLFLGLVLVSCNKDEFTIQDRDSEDAPAWVGHDCGEKGITTTGAGGSPDTGVTDDAAEGGITDPNNDPDGRKKKP